MQKKFLISSLLSPMVHLGAFAVSGATISHASATTLQRSVHPASTYLPTISEGSTGSAVRLLQNQLNFLDDADLVIDGIFGPKTRVAVENWQWIWSLKIDGIVGPQTWRSFREC